MKARQGFGVQRERRGLICWEAGDGAVLCEGSAGWDEAGAARG